MQTSSHAFRKDPFEFGPKTLDSLTTRLLHNQPGLLQSPIVFNSLTNRAIVAIPPETVCQFVQADQLDQNTKLPERFVSSLSDPRFHSESTPSADSADVVPRTDPTKYSEFQQHNNTNKTDRQPQLLQGSQRVSLTDVLPGLDQPVFPTPDSLLSSVHSLRQSTLKQFTEHKQKQAKLESTSFDESLTDQAAQIKQMYEEGRQKQGITGDIGQNSGRGGSGGVLNNHSSSASMDRSRDLDRRGTLTNGGAVLRLSQDQYTSREEWHKRQEAEFGRQDANSFMRWKREKREKELIEEMNQRKQQLTI